MGRLRSPVVGTASTSGVYAGTQISAVGIDPVSHYGVFVDNASLAPQSTETAFLLNTSANQLVEKLFSNAPGYGTVVSPGSGPVFAPDGKSLWMRLSCNNQVPQCTLPSGVTTGGLFAPVRRPHQRNSGGYVRRIYRLPPLKPGRIVSRTNLPPGTTVAAGPRSEGQGYWLDAERFGWSVRPASDSFLNLDTSGLNPHTLTIARGTPGFFNRTRMESAFPSRASRFPVKN